MTSKQLIKRVARRFLKDQQKSPYVRPDYFTINNEPSYFYDEEDAIEMVKLKGLTWNTEDLLSPNEHIRRYAEQFFSNI